jgi:hypothetical protein
MTRKEEVSDLFKHVQEVNELADGYALRFTGNDTWRTRCCNSSPSSEGAAPFSGLHSSSSRSKGQSGCTYVGQRASKRSSRIWYTHTLKVNRDDHVMVR